MDGWYYKVFGSDFGPVTFQELVELAKNNSLSRDDEIRYGENGQWRRAGSVGPIMAHIPFEAGNHVISKAPVETEIQSADEEEIEFSATVTVAEIEQKSGSQFSNRSSTMQAQGISSGSAASNWSTTSTNDSSTATLEEPPENETRWWCQIRNKEYGPVDLPKLVEWASSGRLRRDDYVRVGLKPYVLAGELPGLFPALPTSADKDKKSETSPNSETRETPVVKQRTSEFNTVKAPESHGSSSIETAPAATPTPQPRLSTPTPIPPTRPAMSAMGGGGFGSSSSVAARPTVPVRRPPAKSSSSGGGIGALMMPIGMGVGGLVLVGALVYFTLPIIFSSKGADTAKFKVLEAAVAELTKVRKNDKPSAEDLKAVAVVLEKAAKTVTVELKKIKSPNPDQAKLKLLASKMTAAATELASDDPSKSADKEKAVLTAMANAKKGLGLK